MVYPKDNCHVFPIPPVWCLLLGQWKAMVFLIFTKSVYFFYIVLKFMRFSFSQRCVQNYTECHLLPRNHRQYIPAAVWGDKQSQVTPRATYVPSTCKLYSMDVCCRNWIFQVLYHCHVKKRIGGQGNLPLPPYPTGIAVAAYASQKKWTEALRVWYRG